MISRRNILVAATATVVAATVDGGPATAATAPGTTTAPASGQARVRVTAPTVEYVRHPSAWTPNTPD